MASNRRTVVIFGLLFLALTAFASSLFIVFYPNKTEYYWVGLVVGALFGILTVIYMVYTKAINLEEAQSSSGDRMESPWLLLSVIGGGIIARVAFYFIDPQYEITMISCVLAWIVLTFSYTVFKAWVSFPRE